MVDRTRWIALLGIAACAAFAVGFSVGKSRIVEKQGQPAAAEKQHNKPRPNDVRTLLATLDKYRETLAERDREVERLRAQVEEFRAQLATSARPGDYDDYGEWVKERESRERRKVIEQRSRDLRKRIFQRKDKVLREQALDELAALLQREDPEDILVGLETLPWLRQINLDQQRFRPQVLAAVEHADAGVRLAALHSLPLMLSSEEILHIAAAMYKDPSPRVRGWCAGCLVDFSGAEHSPSPLPSIPDGVAPVLRALAQDEDRSVRSGILCLLWNRRDAFPEMEDLLIELAKDDPMGNPLGWFGYEGPLSEKVVQAFVELYDEGRTGRTVGWTRYGFSDEAKPIAVDFCLRVVREGIEPEERRAALEGLAKVGDPSVILALEEIARSADAEGIEEQLASTLESLRSRANEVR